MIFEVMYTTGVHAGLRHKKELTRCRTKQGQITMNSAFYEAIADGSFHFNLGYGDVNFCVNGHESMQDKIFSDWRKYWNYSNGKYTPKNRSGLKLTPVRSDT